jgi:uncharacterized protein YidB (DUF937 family)
MPGAGQLFVQGGLSPLRDTPMTIYSFSAFPVFFGYTQTRFIRLAIVMKRSTHFPSLWGQSASEAFCAAVVDFVQRHGAVSGIVKRMEQLGFGAIARSWLASDVHVPIFSEQLHALFGTGALRAFAARLGLQPRDLVRRLSQTLPQILNRLAFSEGLIPSASI